MVVNYSATDSLNTLFRNESECVDYLFRKRWPQGFICPFCGNSQSGMAPAFSVVCSFCRKQTSITARTAMHGSRRSLISWMLIAYQFCAAHEGISAREVQHRMVLTSYQTAWRILQKMRKAAALTESTPMTGDIIVSIFPAGHPQPKSNQAESQIGLLLTTNIPLGKLRFFAQHPWSNENFSQWILRQLVPVDTEMRAGMSTTLYLTDRSLTSFLPENILHLQMTAQQQHRIEQIRNRLENWLLHIYKNSVGRGYLQSYLDEFAFRHNTAGWPDRLRVFEHLLEGLLAVDPEKVPPGSCARRTHPEQREWEAE